MSKFENSSGPASTTITRDNGDGTQTERTYQDVVDRKLAERTQGDKFPPSLPVQERTIDKP